MEVQINKDSKRNFRNSKFKPRLSLY